VTRIIYGNGDTTLGEYPLVKDALSAEIIQLLGRIEINWGGGDIDYMDGSSAFTRQILAPINYLFNFLRGSFFVGGVLQTNFAAEWYSTVSYSQIVQIQKFPPEIEYTWVCDGSSSPWTLRAFVRNISGANVFIASASQQTSNASLRNCSISRTYTISGNPIKSSSTNGDWIEVESNLGQKIRKRKSLVDYPAYPLISLMGGGCALSIAYTDNSSEQIPLSECYEWALIVIDCPQWVCDTLDNLINLVGNF